MILHVDEAINASYVQTLCLVFFPGSKFGQNEIPSEDTPEMTVRILSRDDENVTAEAVLLYRQKVTCGTGSATANEDISRSQILKIAVGRAVFEAGKKYFGYMPPWGILTGVRSSKVAVEMLLNGKGIRRARQILRDEYFVNPKKASLAVSVASTEIKLTNYLLVHNYWNRCILSANHKWYTIVCNNQRKC